MFSDCPKGARLVDIGVSLDKQIWPIGSPRSPMSGVGSCDRLVDGNDDNTIDGVD